MIHNDRKSGLIRAFRYSVEVSTEEESDRTMECVQMLARDLSPNEIDAAIGVEYPKRRRKTLQAACYLRPRIRLHLERMPFQQSE